MLGNLSLFVVLVDHQSVTGPSHDMTIHCHRQRWGYTMPCVVGDHIPPQDSGVEATGDKDPATVGVVGAGVAPSGGRRAGQIALVA